MHRAREAAWPLHGLHTHVIVCCIAFARPAAGCSSRADVWCRMACWFRRDALASICSFRVANSWVMMSAVVAMNARAALVLRGRTGLGRQNRAGQAHSRTGRCCCGWLAGWLAGERGHSQLSHAQQPKGRHDTTRHDTTRHDTTRRTPRSPHTPHFHSHQPALLSFVATRLDTCAHRSTAAQCSNPRCSALPLDLTRSDRSFIRLQPQVGSTRFASASASKVAVDPEPALQCCRVRPSCDSACAWLSLHSAAIGLSFFCC